MFIKRDETEKIANKNQYAGIANTHHLHEHIPEQPRQTEKTNVKVYIVGSRTEEQKQKAQPQLQTRTTTPSLRRLP